MWLKKEGLTKSIPDVFISVPNNEYFGFYIEFKAGNNKASDEQLDMHNKLRALGYKVEVIYELEEAIFQVKRYLK